MPAWNTNPAIELGVGFIHAGDPYSGRILADWNAMGLDALGPYISVDGSAAAYNTSHELISSASLQADGVATNHNGAADDAAQPLCPDRGSEYVPVWRYLLQAAAGLGLSGPKTECGS